MADTTHDPSLRSWVESAGREGTHFPIQNLPFGIFSLEGEDESERRACVAIGDSILDISACVEEQLIEDTEAARTCALPWLNVLMSFKPSATRALRHELSDLLRHDSAAGQRAMSVSSRILHDASAASMHIPVLVGDYTDFYASIHHATNVGKMFRPDNPLLPNYKYVPIGYHGRASSIVTSGTSIPRPHGQTKAADSPHPSFGPARMLDYEAELGFFVRRGNEPGNPVPIESAWECIFGFCLVNDWSARDVQAWEYQPLGPFLAKNFATSISPWVVTSEAVEPFRTRPAPRPDGDPRPLPYLHSDTDAESGGINAFVEVWLATARMREHSIAPVRVSRGNFADMYWTVGQMLAHHTSNGCNLRPGDLLASGTISGASPGARGCLLEITSRGNDPIRLPGGEIRAFLEDGDEVIMRGTLEKDGFVPIGFGECRGTILSGVTADTDNGKE